MSEPLGLATGVLIPAGTVATASGTSGLVLEGSSNPENSAAVGVSLYVSVTAASGTTPTLAIQVQSWDDNSKSWFNLGPASTTITGVSSNLIQVYPGAGADATLLQVVPVALPATLWRVTYTIGGTTPSFTFGVGYAYTF